MSQFLSLRVYVVYGKAQLEEGLACAREEIKLKHVQIEDLKALLIKERDEKNANVSDKEALLLQVKELGKALDREKITLTKMLQKYIAEVEHRSDLQTQVVDLRSKAAEASERCARNELELQRCHQSCKELESQVKQLNETMERLSCSQDTSTCK